MDTYGWLVRCCLQSYEMTEPLSDHLQKQSKQLAADYFPHNSSFFDQTKHCCVQYSKQRGLTSEAERCILHCSLWCALHLYAGQSWCIWPVDNMILWAIHRSTLHIWAECYFNHSQICVVHWLIRHFSEHVSRWLTSPFFPSVFCLQINLLIDYSNSKDWHGLQENISHLYQQDDYMSTQADTVRDSECKQWDTGRWWLDEIFWYYVVHRRGVTKPIERGGGSLLHHIP